MSRNHARSVLARVLTQAARTAEHFNLARTRGKCPCKKEDCKALHVTRRVLIFPKYARSLIFRTRFNIPFTYRRTTI